MATTKLKIRNDLVKKSGGGETAIYVQYTYQGKAKYFNTGKKIEPDYWDEAGQCVKRAYRGYTTLNNFIRGKQREIDEIIIDAQKQKIEPTPEYVQQQYDLLSITDVPDASKNFFQLYEEFLNDTTTKIAHGTLKQRRAALKHFKGYEAYSKRKITLEGITMDFYNKFTTYLVSVQDLSPNTVGGIIKNLKIFLGKLTEEGINTNMVFRQRNFTKPSAPVELIALTQEELDKLYQADLSKDAKLSRVRDLFVFGCVTGLRFSDVVNIKPENLRTGTIELTTVKTRDRLSIPLAPYARAILARYDGKMPKSMSNQKMNDYLKELCQQVGIDEPVQKVRYIGSNRIESKAPKWEMVSTHTARRTFITLALERGTRPEIVMRITGHKDIKTMMKYVRLTDKASHNEFLRPFGEGMKSIG